MTTRKSATALTNDERDSLLAAVMEMKATVANPNDSNRNQISIYDQFVALHLGCLSVKVPDGSTSNMGHRGPGFLPWHREFLLRFEQKLVENGANTGLPYWDWTDHAGTWNKLFVDEFLGARYGLIKSGYFAISAPGTASNRLPKPTWWPQNLGGWKIRPSLAGNLGTTLRRRPRLPKFNRPLASVEDVRRTLNRPEYEDSTEMREADPQDGSLSKQPKGFRNRLESGRRMHNYGHGWVSGHMGDTLTSPNDLIFFMHHCNIDRLWAEWQESGHQGTPFYPGPGSGEDEGHKLNDAMWPWIGTKIGYKSNNLPPDCPIPDFAVESSRSPVDVLDHNSLNYVYG